MLIHRRGSKRRTLRADRLCGRQIALKCSAQPNTTLAALLNTRTAVKPTRLLYSNSLLRKIASLPPGFIRALELISVVLTVLD
jgi:hypothetical protein